MNKVDISHTRYDYIQSKIKQARTDGNKRALKLWQNKLEIWQHAYGSYKPIKIFPTKKG